MNEAEITRRELLTRTAQIGVAATLAGALYRATEGTAFGSSLAVPPNYKSKSKTVVFADYGGSSGEARRKAVYNAFEKKYKIKVIGDGLADPARFQLMMESQRSQWDSMDANGYHIVNWVKKGLLQKYPAWVTQCELVPEKYRRYATGSFAFSLVFGYQKDKFRGRRPETWQDFFNVRLFPGRRAMPSGFFGLPVEAALLGDGVRPERLYPLDFDRAFAKLDEIRSSTLFYKTYGEGEQFLADGSVDLAQLTNGRFAALNAKGVPVYNSWHNAILTSWAGVPLPKRAPHADAMNLLADFMAQPIRQAAFAKIWLAGPTNPKAFKYIDKKTAAILPTSPAHLKIAAPVNAEMLAAQQDEYIIRLTEWLAKG